MQGYATVLTRPDFSAVVAYVAKLNGITAPAEEVAPVHALPADAARGRSLFSDPLRGFSRCSTCHQAGGIGIAIAPVASVPSDLRNLDMLHVRLAHIDGESFPALVVSQGGRRTSLYDLSVTPPVLRSADSGAVKVGGTAAWRHPLGSYNDAELKLILDFLRAAR
jgi:mono/diheme cytochrome c family protein